MNHSVALLQPAHITADHENIYRDMPHIHMWCGAIQSISGACCPTHTHTVSKITRSHLLLLPEREDRDQVDHYHQGGKIKRRMSKRDC